MSINSINPIVLQQINQAQQANQINTVKHQDNPGQKSQGSTATVQSSPQDILELGTQNYAPVTYQDPRITRTRAS